MKKVVGIAVALVVAVAVLRRFGPALRDRAIAKCQEMFDRSSGQHGLDRDTGNVVPSAAG